MKGGRNLDYYRKNFVNFAQHFAPFVVKKSHPSVLISQFVTSKQRIRLFYNFATYNKFTDRALGLEAFLGR